MSQVVEYCHYPLSPIRLHDQGNESEATTDVLLADPELAKPPMYAVVMYNDDYTPMDFVVDILQTEFRHNLEQAVDIMLNIHHQGRGIAGIYPKDIAETKAQKVNNMARREGYPLLTQIEPHLDS
ncbi:ATP-dependent Clp protease adapter ClpS [Psychrobacter sp. I-STPA6b]|uniref:ATP-dependent Clp protease adapter ClpS n=1 Tax=Psychrobacter sp. I-STPA6b TaxID=2585718 RepID=UPI001D0C9619|nr:ATP-dependent Clp protease adapter ClpS [Psychrobacter sp. I-STPA6b]